EKLQRERNVIVSKSTIERCIENFKYSFKRVHNIPIRRNDAQSLDDRVIYANMFMNFISTTDDAKIFFIDEVGFNVSMRTSRERSLVGTRAVHNVTSIRSRNISVCCSMNKRGIFKYSTQTRPFNTDTFLNFIREMI
ncbi:hypothetical protein CDIK_3506, partial [Cucumispora dikerogammari]